jgi:hypothetical protein
LAAKFVEAAFDYQGTLLLVDGPSQAERVSAELVIEAPIRYTAEDRRWSVIQPGDVATLGPVVTLFGRTVQDATFDGRVLALDFGNDVRIEVGTMAHYESWNLTGHGIQGYIAGPWDLDDRPD